MEKDISFDDWVKEGYSRGWIGPPICQTHDGIPMTEQEDKDFDEGGDPCVHVIRLYEDESIKLGVEQNHSPSIWRASNQGLGKSDRAVTWGE
jgi:hypothetical protein